MENSCHVLYCSFVSRRQKIKSLFDWAWNWVEFYPHFNWSALKHTAESFTVLEVLRTSSMGNVGKVQLSEMCMLVKMWSHPSFLCHINLRQSWKKRPHKSCGVHLFSVRFPDKFGKFLAYILPLKMKVWNNMEYIFCIPKTWNKPCKCLIITM